VKADQRPIKSAEERAKGLAALYWSTVRQEEPAKPVKLPETLPPDHPWAACWQKSRFAGKEIIVSGRVIRG
jgi:bifunctional ADP-heptose synthase (sugar kinase/adenylyltransferase)